MTQEKWMIYPRRGMSDLRFGTRFDEVSRISAAYGEIESDSQGVDQSAVTQSTLELFGDALSEEDRRWFEEVHIPSLGADKARRLSLLAGTLQLKFDGDELTEIMVVEGEAAPSIGGLAIFNTPAEDLLPALERLNGEPGHYTQEMARFDQLAIELFGFSAAGTGPDSPITPGASLNNEQERSIWIGTAPNPRDDPTVRWRPHSWL